MSNQQPSNFVRTVRSSDFHQLTDGGVHLVVFWAPSCGSCARLKPVLESVAVAVEGRAWLWSCNLDENEDLGERYDVRFLPLCVVFKNGQVMDKIIGVKPEEKYLEVLRERWD